MVISKRRFPMPEKRYARDKERIPESKALVHGGS
jgi:hypothetical protein